MTSLVYLDGTASVSTGSALVTGHGTAWKIALVEGGSFSLAGLSVPILSVDSDTSLTLAYDWPGDTLEEARYAIARETSQAIRAAWINDRLAQFHQKPWGIGVLPDGRGTLAERNALNPMPFDNYCWLRVEVDQPAELYFKVPAGWLGPFRLSGEVGPVGPAGVLRWRTEGWSNAVSYQVNDGLAHNGTSYRAYVAHEASPATQPGVGANWQSVWQVTAQGTILIEGTTTTLPPDQPARVEFEPVPGGYAVNFFVPRGPTGDIDGVTPFWVSRLGADTDAEAARTGLGATATGAALFVAEGAEAARSAIGATTTGSNLIIAANAGAGRTAIEAVGYTSQTLTAPQKLQARNNIGAQEDLGWRPIQIVDVASSVAAIVVAIPSGIQHIRFSGRIKTSIITAATMMRIGTSAGSFLTTGYIRANLFQVADQVIPQGNTAESSFIFAYENGDVAFPTQIDAQLDIGPNPWYPRFFGRSAAYRGSPAANVLAIYHGWYTGSVLPTHLQIYPNTGNIAAGTKILIEGM